MRQSLPDNKLTRQNTTTKCLYKLPQQFVTTNRSKISCITDVFIYFPHGLLGKCTWSVVYLALMKLMTLLSHFCSLQDRKCNNKVKYLLLPCFSWPYVRTNKNVKVAVAKGSLLGSKLNYFRQTYVSRY